MNKVIKVKVMNKYWTIINYKYNYKEIYYNKMDLEIKVILILFQFLEKDQQLIIIDLKL